MKPSNKIIIEFPTPEDATEFLAYLCDGGGEQDFDTGNEYKFNYSRAFPFHGYSPKKHGPDRIVLVEERIP